MGKHLVIIEVKENPSQIPEKPEGDQKARLVRFRA